MNSIVETLRGIDMTTTDVSDFEIGCVSDLIADIKAHLEKRNEWMLIYGAAPTPVDYLLARAVEQLQEQQSAIASLQRVMENG